MDSNAMVLRYNYIEVEMKHEEVYKYFQTQFPNYDKYVNEWFPNGKNSVRVRIQGGSDFIFTYNNWMDWCFETVASYIPKMRGGTRMNVGLCKNSHENE